jgi:hypothetical protein
MARISSSLTGSLPGAAIGDVAIGDGGLDQPQRRHAAFAPVLDRVLECLGDLFAHGLLLLSQARTIAPTARGMQTVSLDKSLKIYEILFQPVGSIIDPHGDAGLLSAACSNFR